MSRDRTRDFGRHSNDYELSQVGRNAASVTSFFDEVSLIQEMIKQINENIKHIDDSHSRSLGTINEDESAKRQLESITDNTRQILVQVKDKIRHLESLNLGLPPDTSDLEVRKMQTLNLRNKFMETLTKYQNVEYQNRQKYRARMERQYKIVNPQATEEEIEAALDKDEGAQVFAQSLLTATRYGAAKDALKEVQERHNDIKKIEKTIEELANLFQEMQMLVVAQEEVVANIETHANQVTADLEQGVVHVEKALESAKGARRKKWYCFWITVVLLIVAAIVLYIYLRPKSDSSPPSSSVSTQTVTASVTSVTSETSETSEPTQTS